MEAGLLRFNKMTSLVKRVAFTKWARRLFWHKSIFRLCLFLDMSIIFYELHDAICGWLVKLEKIDGLLFLDILGGAYFYIADLKIDMSNIISS